jgi:RNA polymerase sigma-54 factor
MEIMQGIHLEQKQILAPVLRQSLEILEMNNQQLDEYVEKQQLENPILDRGDSEGCAGQCAAFTVQYHPSGRKKSQGLCDSTVYNEIPEEQSETLEKYLVEQLDIHEITEMEYRLAVYMIREIDSDGYLRTTLNEICKVTGTEMRQADKCLAMIQKMEPAGVGARNLEECLKLQLERSNQFECDIKKLIAFHLKDVASCHMNKIAREMHISRRRTEELVATLRALTPRPASGIDGEKVQYIIPDIIVKCSNEEMKILLNDRWMRPPVLNSYYLSLAHSSASCDEPELETYLSKKICQAKFVLNSIERRRNTILSIMRVILDQQCGFFRDGGSLAPLSMQFAALALGVHESTICRAVKDKYVQCDRGTFPMRYFFVRHISREISSVGEKEISTPNIKELIYAMIKKENKQFPLSDAALTDRFKKKDICISRRTVTKYREEMGVGNAFVRRNDIQKQLGEGNSVSAASG